MLTGVGTRWGGRGGCAWVRAALGTLASGTVGGACLPHQTRSPSDDEQVPQHPGCPYPASTRPHPLQAGPVYPEGQVQMALPLTGLVSQLASCLQGLLMQAFNRWHSRPGHGGRGQRERRLPTPAPQGGPLPGHSQRPWWRAPTTPELFRSGPWPSLTQRPSWGSPLTGPTKLQGGPSPRPGPPGPPRWGLAGAHPVRRGTPAVEGGHAGRRQVAPRRV